MPQANASTATAMVALDSPEFHEAVAAAVALALAGSSSGAQQPVVIPQTSIDETKPSLDDLTVRFRRFCTFQNCGYQRGQEAGFPRKAAEDLANAGAAFIVHDPRRSALAA